MDPHCVCLPVLQHHGERHPSQYLRLCYPSPSRSAKIETIVCGSNFPLPLTSKTFSDCSHVFIRLAAELHGLSPATSVPTAYFDHLCPDFVRLAHAHFGF
ncbi:Cell adhesion molecule DSCAML1 [Trichinella spiralis]|uniref:Cell adhesion molecule DSCAML1 n=1 Tax=Trichinella spiralis TaxID=6334 RepID=A0ABR3KGY3_TRISP